MSKKEIWLNGPVEGIQPLLQPVAHAFLQVRQDVEEFCSTLDENLLWKQPGGAAPIGFHIGHLTRATERLLTYARGETLNDRQIAALKAEAQLRLEKNELLDQLRLTMDAALEQLRSTKAEDLDKVRTVGKEKLPSTVIGLLFHSAEHAQRHSGQIATSILALRSTPYFDLKPD